MIEYIVAKEDDYKSINDFYNRLHNSNRTLEQFIWEFHNGPVRQGIYIIAKDTENDSVIGSQAVIPINLITSNGKIILSGKSEDTLVDPSYRGKRIFNNMYEKLFDECTKNGINYIWGFTTAKKPFSRMNFDIPWSHSQSLLVNKVIPAQQYLSSLNDKNKSIDKAKILGLCVSAKFKKVSLKAKRELSGYLIKETQAIDVKDLILKIIQRSGSEAFGIYQDESYQKWRFYDNPNFNKVDSFIIEKDGKLQGFFITNTNKENVAYISQAVVNPDIPEKIKINFINYCSKSLFDKGVVLIRNWNFQHTPYNKEEVSLFKKSGYTYLDRGVPFVWKTQIDKGLSADNFVIFRIASEGTV